MKPKRVILGWVLLTLTVIATVLELAGAFTNTKDVDTWTEWIVAYIPWEASIAAYGALAVWLPFHFYRNYKERYSTKYTPLNSGRPNDIQD